MEKHIKGYSFLRGFLGFGFKLVYQIKITGKENIPVRFLRRKAIAGLGTDRTHAE